MRKSLLKSPVGYLFIAAAAVAAATNWPAANPTLIDSPWNHYHSTMAMQASSPLAGPTDPQPLKQISDFATDAGVEMGTSPWHVIGSNHYTDSPTARAVWGVTFEWLYKYIVDGDRFELVDKFELNHAIGNIGWNFFQLNDGRIVVPNPGGLRTVPRFNSCYGTEPALLVFEERNNRTTSKIKCVEKFEITKPLVSQHCGWDNWDRITVGTGNTIMHNGHIGIHINRKEPAEAYMLIVDSNFTIKTCEYLGQGSNTNGAPSEPLSPTKDAMYFAMGTKMVKATYDAATNQFNRIWEKEAGFRAGRTGSTPTLMGLGSDNDKFVVAIDARCAVQDPFTAEILCDADTSPSKLVAIRRDTGQIITHDLPQWLDTVECSPTVMGYHLAVSDYSGYTYNGMKEGQPDFAKGIVKVSWDESAQRFVTDWERDDIQMSGVNTISGGSGMIYGSGAADDGYNYAYGLDLNSGMTLMERQIGPRDIYYDAGNNLLINDDGSIIWPAGESLVRLRDQ